MKEFESYYSKAYAWIFAFFVVLFLVGIVMFSIFWMPLTSLLAIITLSTVSVTFTILFISTIKKDGVAVEVFDDKLILHKKDLIEIPILDIEKVTLNDNHVSFDISIRTFATRYSMHCFIKKQWKKQNELISLLESKGVKVRVIETDVGD